MNRKNMVGGFSRIVGRIRVFLNPHAKAELDEELWFHVEQSIAANAAQGLDAGEARRRALIDFGGVDRAREETYRQRPGWLLETILQDVRYAVRGFRRSPGFTFTIVATLALGIGATTAVLSVVDPILFRPLPYAEGGRLVSVGLTAPIIPVEFMLGGSYYTWRDNQTPFAAFTSETGVTPCDLTEHNPARLSCARVERSFLPTLGIAPILGRNFLPEEDRPNGPAAALLSYGLWQSHYGGDRGVVNRQVDIDGKPVRVIGVLPREFEMPALEAADIVLPEALDEAAERREAPDTVMYGFARLKPGVSLEQARAALDPVFQYSLSLAPPQFRKEVHLRVRSLRDRQMQGVQQVAWVLLGAVFAVLLIACANVGGLLMARRAAREREWAVRSAFGASRGRLLMQGLTEALLVTGAGAAVGCALAEGLLRVFTALAPAGILFLGHARLDLRILLFTLLVSLACGAILGVLPAMERPRALSLTGRNAQSKQSALLRRFLVAGQLAVCMVLMTGAALLLRSFRNIEGQNTGIHADGAMAAHIALPGYRYSTGRQRMDFFLQAETALRRLPGVTAVGISDSLPPGDTPRDHIYSLIAIEGRPRQTGGTGGMVAWRWVTPGYFSALNIPITHGQAFTEAERNQTEQEIILGSLFASRLFGQEDPVGKRVQATPNGPWYTVRGVAANVKNAGLTGNDEPEYYRLRRNLPEDWNADGVLVVKTALDPEGSLPWIRAQFANIDPTLPVEAATLRRQLSELADRPRFETALMAFFAACGLLIAVIGLYGVVSFLAERRTQEIGVRMALGAGRADILRLIAGEGLRLVALGGALGLAGALATAHLLRSLLFQVGPRDPLSLIAVGLLLALVALMATLIPARRAMRVDPALALRSE